MLLGFDPGRDKCGVAVMADNGHPQDRSLNGESDIVFADVVVADEAIATVLALMQRYPISTLVMGDQTTAKQWQSKFEHCFKDRVKDHSPSGHAINPAMVQNHPISIVLVDERYSTLEARDRYWQLHPPTGLNRFIPQALRTIPRPIDDVVAIILIERYWHTLMAPSQRLSVSSAT